jgi:hypothetical protein
MFNNPSSCSKLRSGYWRYPSPWPANFLRSHRRTRRQTCQCTIEYAEAYHVLNRGVGRRTLFEKEGDVLAFERALEETLRTRPMRVCAYCLLPNHFHFVLWPACDDPAFPILSPWPLPRPTNWLASGSGRKNAVSFGRGADGRGTWLDWPGM